MKKENTEGTILQFLNGTHSYEGVWLGDKHPTREGLFWWRPILIEYFKEQIIDAYHINPLETKWGNIGTDYYNQKFNQNK